MLRPATLLRGFATPSRLALRQTALSTTPLARAYSTPSQPPSTTTTTTRTTTASNPPPSSSPAAQEPASVTQPQVAKPYFVRRTPSNQLAVYHLAKRGGNKKLTTIKKVEGDRARFRSALAQGLGLPEKGVVVNNLTGHIIVPGHRKEEVTGWLEKQGF
ncbi:hypothetical protein MYCTH_2305931 [Thermothelomyces thermophilus ATCC 42464]|uniref:Large ribosomal subunit protein mL49 n=1 Tax=Thermothelomyces thermophilus (strain ATCC 42464 / BCRC 31852 / DSM 1799) TaxID=573729 RepID=G2QG64_THET4|nr:uncharacterized protein MYCTH_2305931 [Thermothelomyces thermophilus ATCC 42464]AEO58529.1 hypothetical protein MYCTH_2305931 [Thermothelomyces thermophilus ATCC 42464]